MVNEGEGAVNVVVIVAPSPTRKRDDVRTGRGIGRRGRILTVRTADRPEQAGHVPVISRPVHFKVVGSVHRYLARVSRLWLTIQLEPRRDQSPVAVNYVRSTRDPPRHVGPNGNRSCQEKQWNRNGVLSHC